MAEDSIDGWKADHVLIVKWHLCHLSLGTVDLALQSEVANAAYPIPVSLDSIDDTRYRQIEEVKRPGQA